MVISQAWNESEQISAQYLLNVFKLDDVVTNFETLTDEGIKTVQNTFFENAKAYFAMKRDAVAEDLQQGLLKKHQKWSLKTKNQ